MTFLYRLMFILYAESLELLPLHERHGYGEHSLYRMKHEIADAGGTLLDESPDKLGKQYKTSSTELYDRLKALFTVIDQRGRTNSTCQPITVACSARRRTAVSSLLPTPFRMAISRSDSTD